MLKIFEQGARLFLTHLYPLLRRPEKKRP